MGANRAKIISQTPGAELVWVCSIQEDKVQQVAAELDCDGTAEYEKML